MKILKYLSVILFTGIIFSACQKEYDIIDSTATGTLKEDTSGDCMPVTINGIYTANVNVSTANFVDIQVNIDNIGIYDIRTDTVNGYYFTGTGSVAITGLNTIRLHAGGKPIISGIDIFKVKFSGTVCELNVSVVTGVTTSAVFTLRAATTGAACTGAVQSGAYNQGLATSSSNTVTVFADVTTAGTYTATTTNVNGVSFSGSGTLAVGTNQPITLTANGGTPTAAGTFNYPVIAGTSTCNFDVIYGAILPPAVLTANCAGATINGTYQAGIVMTSANTITIPVVVTTAGTYTVSTALQNGVSFSSSGLLTTSSTSITLITSAVAPTNQGLFIYPITINGSPACSVSINYTTGTNTDSIVCKIDGVAKAFKVNDTARYDDIAAQGYHMLNIWGSNAAGDEGFELEVGVPIGGSLIAGTTYIVNQFPANIVSSLYGNNTGNSYLVSPIGFGTPPSPFFTITINTISTTKVTGTFSGAISDVSGVNPNINVQNGIFSVTIYP
jgi:hypothetical protein